jgi:hypothetical protein
VQAAHRQDVSRAAAAERLEQSRVDGSLLSQDHPPQKRRFWRGQPLSQGLVGVIPDPIDRAGKATAPTGHVQPGRLHREDHRDPPPGQHGGFVVLPRPTVLGSQQAALSPGQRALGERGNLPVAFQTEEDRLALQTRSDPATAPGH